MTGVSEGNCAGWKKTGVSCDSFKDVDDVGLFKTKAAWANLSSVASTENRRAPLPGKPLSCEPDQRQSEVVPDVAQRRRTVMQLNSKVVRNKVVRFYLNSS
jgi:hypothetical protein